MNDNVSVYVCIYKTHTYVNKLNSIQYAYIQKHFMLFILSVKNLFSFYLDCSHSVRIQQHTCAHTHFLLMKYYDTLRHEALFLFSSYGETFDISKHPQVSCYDLFN